MRPFFYLLLIGCFILLHSSCRTRSYRADAGRFLIAQQAPDPGKQEQMAMMDLKDPGTEISQPKARDRAQAIKKARQLVTEKTIKISSVKARAEELIVNRLTATKQLKKAQEFRVVDLVFFIVLALLLTTVLVLLKQFGLSTDALIFIAMGAAVVIALIYIYLRTWIFTA